MKVLVLEDDEGVGQVLVSCLGQWDQETVLVKDAGEAWQKLNQDSFDLFIVDWQVPVMTGTDLVQKVRQTEQYRHMPILMISGRAGKQDIVRAVEAGINGFLTKPFTPNQLREKIVLVWKRRQTPSFDKALSHVVKGHQHFDPGGEGPLVLFGEASNSLDGLRRPDRRAAAKYLIRAVQAIDQTNQVDPDLNMGYLVEARTHDVILRLKRKSVRRRVKLLMASTDCGGDAYLLMRSVNLNKKDDFSTVLVCSDNEQMPGSVRAELEKLEVEIFRRSELDEQTLLQIIKEHVVQRVRYGEEAVGTPGERARRRFEDSIAEIDTLPVLPQVTARIQALAEDDASDIRAWAEAIKGDPAALSVILRQARLADPPYDGRMNAIERAVGQLGKEQVVALVGDPKALHRTQLFERSGFVLEDFWHHNLAVAYAASLLAFPLQLDQQTPEQQQRLASFKIPELELEELRRIDLPGRLGLDPTRDEPYLAGLVHDLGKVAMVQAYPQWYAQIEAALKERGWQTGMTRLEASLADGFDHAAAGGALAEAWGFDDELCRVIRSHHRPDPDDALSWLVGFADVIGQRVCPFPLASHYPFDPAWSVQGLDRIKDLLPQGFGEQAWLSAEEFCFVGRLWAPVVRQLVDQRIPD